MPNDLVANDLIAGGYYGPGYRETPITKNPRRLNEYIATFKHALLFLPKLVLADHMVVNSPNFRIAYHKKPEFRRFFETDLVEIAHFERYGNGGPHFTLIELRTFYENGRFHGRMPLEFQTAEFDDELGELQSRVSQPVIDSSRRDPRFTELALDHLNAETFKPLFGKLYGAYDAAFRRLNRDQPVLGIIHFDPERRWPGDRNIFDYMADSENLHGQARQLERKFGPKIGRAHRALIVKAELELIGQVQPILPPELDEYRILVCPSANLDLVDPRDAEHVVEPIDLSAIGIRGLVSLTRTEMGALRAHEKAQAYFDMFQNARLSNAPFSIVVDCLRDYVRYLDMFFQDRGVSPESYADKLHSRVDILRGKVLTPTGVEIGVTTSFQFIAWLSFTAFAFTPTQVLTSLGKVTSEALNRFLPIETGSPTGNKTVDARVEFHRAGAIRETLMQYE